MRILVISPFFVMPPVAALVWKNMMLNPGYGMLAISRSSSGRQPVDWFDQYPLFSVIIIVAWQWLPFATLILLTALQSLTKSSARPPKWTAPTPLNRFFYIILPHLARAITVVILIQTIFLLGVFAEIRVTTNGGPGYALHQYRLPGLSHRPCSASISAAARPGGIVAVILANIVAIFLMRVVGKNLDA